MLGYQRYNKLYGESYIIERAKKSERFFAYLFDHYYDILYFYFRKRGVDNNGTEDLISLTFMSIADKIQYIDSKKGGFVYWVLRIAYYHFLNFIRNTKKADSSVVSLVGFEDIVPDNKYIQPEDYINTSYLIEYVLQSTGILSQKEIKVFTMVYIDSLSVFQIAKSLGIEEVSVRSMISKINKKLRLQLQNLIR